VCRQLQLLEELQKPQGFVSANFTAAVVVNEVLEQEQLLARNFDSQPLEHFAEGVSVDAVGHGLADIILQVLEHVFIHPGVDNLVCRGHSLQTTLEVYFFLLGD